MLQYTPIARKDLVWYDWLGDWMFAFNGPCVKNSLPAELCSQDMTLDVCREHLKHYYTIVSRNTAIYWQPFSNFACLLTAGWCLENLVMISLTVQESSWDKQTNGPTDRHYWKEYPLAMLRCAGGNYQTGHCLCVHSDSRVEPCTRYLYWAV